MPRVWLTCALATGVVVAAVILLTNRPAAEADGQHRPKPPSPLSEQEVRTYIDVMPQLTRTLGDIAAEYQRERVKHGGNLDEAAEKALDIKAQGLVDALFAGRGLTRETWQRLSERVEYAVNALRALPELEKARPEIEEQITIKKTLLANLGQADERAMVEKEIGKLEALLEYKGPPLLERDRDLIRRYWRDLDSAVPQRGPPR